MTETNSTERTANTRGTDVAKNVLFNMAGQVLPALAAFLAVPILLRVLGTERFALLAIAWTVVGYFSIFDFGFGRALTRELAAGRESDRQWLGSLVWTALAVLGSVGVVLALILALLTPVLVSKVLNVPSALQKEAQAMFFLLALALPSVTLGNALRGILEAEHAFRLLTIIRIPTAIGMVLGPLLVAFVTPDLFWVVASIVLFRLLSFGWHLAAAIRRISLLHRPHPIAREYARILATTGGWITVSSLISPLMVSADRFLLGSMLSLTAVAYYSTAYEIATKLWLVAGAVAGVLFPAFAESLARERAQAARLLTHALRSVFVLLFPIASGIVLFAPELLTLWVGADIAANSSHLLVWMTCAVLFNCLGQMYFAFLQSGGHAKWTALFHLLELPLYVGLFLLFVPLLGLFGAALAWAVRMALDTMLLAVASQRLQREAFPVREFAFKTAIITLLLASGTLASLQVRATVFVVLNGIVMFYAYVLQGATLSSFFSQLLRRYEASE